MALEVGNKIDGWCGRCKAVVRHTIETMAGEKITRVQCNTCGGWHLHRPKAPRSRAAGTGTPISHELRYEKLVAKRTDAHSTPYSSTSRYQVGQLVSHASFGLGVVTGARDGVKIDVLFADGAKVLMQAAS